jgi:Cu(I)/Ag(I) efflux system membrane fusion protein
VITQIEADSITLDHAPVPALRWPAMTMPFSLADAALARGLKKGEAVSFTFDKQGEDYRITAIAKPAAPADPHAGHAPAAAASGAAR